VDEELAVLCTVQSELEMQAVRGMLDEAEIPYIIRSARVPGYDGVFEMYAGYFAAVLVHARDSYRARRVTEDWRELASGLSAPEEAPPALTPQERLDQHRTRLGRIAADALTALVMLLALPVLLVDGLLRQRAVPRTAAAHDGQRPADELRPAGGRHAG
jgi:hypothetical protein